MPDISPTEQKNATELAGLQGAGLKERARQRQRRARQQRMQQSPPNGAEYALVGSLAAINDLIDILTVVFTVTGVWLVILKIIDLATAGALFSWAFFRGVKKTQGGQESWLKNRMVKWGVAFIVELIPIVGELSPTWTISVMLAWREHKKTYQESVAQRSEERQTRKQQQAQEHSQAQLEGTYAQYTQEQEALPEAA